MWRFIGIRLLQAVPVILAVITITFFLVRLAPGGPFDELRLGSHKNGGTDSMTLKLLYHIHQEFVVLNRIPTGR